MNFLFLVRKSRKNEFVDVLRRLGAVDTISSVRSFNSKVKTKNEILVFDLKVSASVKRKLNRIQMDFLN